MRIIFEETGLEKMSKRRSKRPLLRGGKLGVELILPELVMELAFALNSRAGHNLPLLEKTTPTIKVLSIKSDMFLQCLSFFSELANILPLK